MSHPAAWLPRVKLLLAPDEELIDWLAGEFARPGSSRKTGLLCATTQRVVFYRKGLLGAETGVWPITDVTDATVADFAGIRTATGGVAELRLTLSNVGVLRMAFISRGNPYEFAERFPHA